MSERARERVVHRYYQSWLESSIGYRPASDVNAPESLQRFHLDGTVLRASNDKSLIAFAQLGCLRLGAKRGIVTLLSTSRQYILAEATKTTSLNPLHDNHGEGDELWFGNASIPRSQGISADALTPPTYTAIGPDGSQHSAPALVVYDIAEDNRYRHREYAGHGVSFYCGVPLVTTSGFPIGVYTVTDDKPRDGLAPEELRFIQDMAVVIMDHLQTVQNDSARFRGERLVLGLGRFVQGESTFSKCKSTIISSDAESSMSAKHPASTLSAGEHVKANRFKGLTITDADPNALRHRMEQTTYEIRNVPGDNQTMTTLASSDGTKPFADGATDEERDDNTDPEAANATIALEAEKSFDSTDSSQSQAVAQVYARAANILRECAAADGVVFYDAVSDNFAKGPATGDYADTDISSRTGSGSSDDTTTEHSSDREAPESSMAASGETKARNVLTSRGKKCRMLGYSLDISSGSTATRDTINTLALSEASMRRFIRRYPRGKMFYFTDTGGFSSDSDQTPVVMEEVEPDEQNPREGARSKRLASSHLSIAAELIQVVPGAHSVMWLPLWDFAKRRWSAGSFLWSRRPDRLLSAQADLTYLRTFASCIMGEISRVEATASDSARTTFMANMSHELRSPLHGILGSIEFLQDTSLDDFQSSMTSAIETCGRTLLDTVENVLHFAKINNLLKKHPKRKGDGRSAQIREEESAFERDFNLADVIEDVVEAVYSGHTFRSGEKVEDAFHPAESDDTPSLETTRANAQQANAKFESSVKVILSIQKLDGWLVHGQPGAIRRIVMNLFGNALKYTRKGTIRVALTSDTQGSNSSRRFCITITDTGIGIAPEFLRNHAFTAFTQESRFSTGAGLGLSIVRQIVNALRGQVEVSSRQGEGTEIKVWLALPKGTEPQVTSTTNLLDRVSEQTIGRTVCLLDPAADDKERLEKKPSHKLTVHAGLEDLLTQWFGMRVMTASSMEDVSADFFVYAEPHPLAYLLHHDGIHARNTKVPVLIIATNEFGSSARLSSGIHELTDLGRVVEVTAQPCGPQKLAKILHRAMSRLAQLARDPQSQLTMGPADTDVNVDSATPMPYLGDSDSNLDAQKRLKRAHSDHAQPDKRTRTDPAAASGISERPGRGRRRNPSFFAVDPAELLDVDDHGFSADRDEPGSTLSLTSRARSGTSTHRAPADSSSHTADKTTPSTPNLSSAGSVLLVDDNDINLKLLIACMQRAGLAHETAQDGAEAVEAYKRRASSANAPARFAHVLMDVSMPVMDGVAATREIRQFEKKANLSPPANIVALTGQASETVRKEMFDAGADEFRTKPVKFKELMALLEKAP